MLWNAPLYTTRKKWKQQKRKRKKKSPNKIVLRTVTLTAPRGKPQVVYKIRCIKGIFSSQVEE